MVLPTRNKMSALAIIFICWETLSVLAFTLPSRQGNSSMPLNSTQYDNTEKMCNLHQLKNSPLLSVWQEIPERAQGCSVPFSGPRGHGQHPEEVHIIHLTEVDKLMQTFSYKQDAMVEITLWLEAASCQSKMRTFFNSVTVNDQNRTPPNNGTDANERNSEMTTKRNNISITAKLNNLLLSDLSDQSGYQDQKDSLQTFSMSSKPIRPLVLLLTSDRPVTWHIKTGACWIESLAMKIQAIVERGSTVISNLAVETIHKIWIKKINRKIIQRYARRTFHGVASFTQIRGANLVRISIGPGGFIDHKTSNQVQWSNRNKLNFCDFSSREDSYLVSACTSVPSPAESCTAGNNGKNSAFIILEVESIFEPSKNRMPNSMFDLINSGNRSHSFLPQVMVLLSESTNFKTMKNWNSTRNYTVFLQSHKNIQWILSSTVQQNYITVVVNEGAVIECLNSCGDTLKINTIHMPGSRLDLKRKILFEYGHLADLFILDRITRIELKLGETVSQITQDVHPHLSFSSTLTSTLKRPLPTSDVVGTSNTRSFERILESEMVVVCEKSMFEIVMPAFKSTQLGVEALRFKDRACRSVTNGTHLILKSHIKNCGTEIHSSDRSPVVSNTVFVELSSGNVTSMKGSDDIHKKSVNQAGIPITCGFKPEIDAETVRSIFNIRGDLMSEEDKGMENSSPESSSSIYQLELFHKSTESKAVSPIIYKNKIDIDDKIYVQIWMDDAPSARAIPESCWISSSLQSSKNMSLLSGMCPVGKEVRLEPQSSLKSSSKPKSFVFSFQVLEDVLKLGHELLIHCQIGICLSNSKLSKGKSLLCVDPQDYCQQQYMLSSHLSVSTAHQLVTKGPISLTSVRKPYVPDSSSQTKCSDVTVIPQSSMISMDMTAAIAVCSFIIGMALTATLWWIHQKTEPTHRGCQREHSLGSQTAVLGSSLSPHSVCSSTNSQCAITS